ncbi:glycosyltransferase [Rhizosaccharibacter radicis]|uniref:Glycosyltransferase n=1 Tax=Rhizosaccharibacter radicis TaxID=2782605 RepID=A0ABT1W0D6_9PROT|nr:glycosyltransferase [Acetobacteraceae bacterium KSS12]
MSVALLLSGVSLLVWVGLIAGHGRFWSAGPVLTPEPAAPMPPAGSAWPLVSVVVPARDEADSIEAALGSLLRQDYPGPMRVVLVDDDSADGTGALARALPDPQGRLRVIAARARPPGWSGKLWAVSQGVAEARRLAPGEAESFVLLCDADIVHEPAHLTTLVAKALRDRLDQVSEMVELRCESAPERALVPAFVFFFQLLYPFHRVNDPRSRVAAAAGGTILVRRAALERIGGIESLKGALIDDVTLATRLKRFGPVWLGHSMLARSIRPYPRPVDIWRMVARTAYVQLRFSPLLLAGTVLGMGLVWMVPLGCLLFAHGWARGLGAAAWVLSTGSFLPTLRRFRLSPAWALLLPAIALFYTLATLGSAFDHHRGRGVVWKNRAYRGEGDASAA